MTGIRIAGRWMGCVPACSQELPRDRAAIFPSYAGAANPEPVAPTCLHFRMLTPRPLEMNAGVLIDYRMRLHGVPLRWRSEITVWEPPRRFVDVQRRGPYRWWRHQHLFREKQNGGTVVSDVVEYGVWGGALVHRLFVAPDLRRIFSYRSRQLRAIFR